MDIDGKGSEFKLPDEYPPVWEMLRESGDGVLEFHFQELCIRLRSDIVDGHLYFRGRNKIRHTYVARTIRGGVWDGLHQLRKAEKDQTSDTV